MGACVTLGYMKARRPMVCECCKGHIGTGSPVSMLHGRPWIPAHAVAYQAKRRGMAASGATQG